MQNEKEIKRKIRYLRKFKKDTKVGSPTRRDFNRQIRELRKKLYALTNCDDKEKQELVKRVYELEPNLRKIKINLYKHTKKDLQFHINKVLEKRKRR